MDHDLAHFSMKPMQWSPKIMQQIFGEEDGFPTFIRTAEELGKWLMPYMDSSYKTDAKHITNHI